MLQKVDHSWSRWWYTLPAIPSIMLVERLHGQCKDKDGCKDERRVPKKGRWSPRMRIKDKDPHGLVDCRTSQHDGCFQEGLSPSKCMITRILCRYAANEKRPSPSGQFSDGNQHGNQVECVDWAHFQIVSFSDGNYILLSHTV